MNEHSLKLHFFMLERSQRKHNSLDCHKFFKYFPLIKKIMCSKIDKNQKKKIAYSKHSNLENESPCFFQTFLFFYRMCTILFKNWKGF